MKPAQNRTFFSFTRLYTLNDCDRPWPGRSYKLQSKHTSNLGFDQTFMPCSDYILFAAEQRVGYQISWVAFSAKLIVREICRATFSARQTRLQF